MQLVCVRIAGWCYRIVRPAIFLFDSEVVHEAVLTLGKVLSRVPGVVSLMRGLFFVSHRSLTATYLGIAFPNPIGLAAGFDYRADLARLLPGLGFGFGTIGTLTHEPYEGNQKPRLGRLVRSQALLVNKGFKNDSVAVTLDRLGSAPFGVPVGVSIGRTNTLAHTTQEEAVADVVEGFREAEASGVPFVYYELNISCPNLRSPIEFYDPEHLRPLLEAVTSLGLARPIFIKMPIDRSDDELTAMLDVIMEFPIAGIIIGNLQRNRNDPSLVREEVARYARGNFSGKPTVVDSNRHIAHAYRHTNGKLIIIGCGGVFTAEDAYAKIRAGASLIELATGLVFKGPLVAGTICARLPVLLARDGFAHYQDAIGVDA